ncbi:MAG: B12-binding domain-containing radical SAM protein [Lachnospiraceae bacterium]|nr:B12-binding domain-containing radical SAM protein [Lachnospiraceae bacterium]
MNTLLVAINSKYIHSNLAVYSLSAYAKSKGHTVNIKEYTINQQPDAIIRDIYSQKPDLIGFSCYIWNIEYVIKIVPEIKKILPNCIIIIGGPEVSFETDKYFEKLPDVDVIIIGEGEITFANILDTLSNKPIFKTSDLLSIQGIAINNPRTTNTLNTYLNMDELPFPYENVSDFRNKVIYYESSRGCPYSCSYCLSSVDKRVRFRNLELVKKELLTFINAKVAQVKFVDRTFNCNRERTAAIWQFILDNDNGITNFHFEISADIITPEEINLLSKMRPGLVQLEIGVQTTNTDTLNAIYRNVDFKVLSDVVTKINRLGNVHQHLDLIAGLPYEDYSSFSNSFNDVYALKPEQLQLGFLKILSGSNMQHTASKMNIQYTNYPPYEVISTPWISYEDIQKLKGIEEMVEMYYNSGQFNATIAYIIRYFDNPFAFYGFLANYFANNDLTDIGHSRIKRYSILLDAITSLDKSLGIDIDLLKETLCYDLYLRENLKSRPEFLPDNIHYKKKIHSLYLDEERIRKILPDYSSYTTKQIERLTTIQHFSIDMSALISSGDVVYKENYVLFDYLIINKVTHSAKTITVQL